MHKHFSVNIRLLIIVIQLLTISNAGQPAQDENKIIKFSYSQRMRIEMWDNTIGLSKALAAGSSYLRNRSSLSLSFNPKIDVNITFKITNEVRYYTVPESRGFEFDEVFIDLLFLNWKNIFNLPVTLTAGRQNISLGEGFVVMDGGPLDGSRSGYFNALRLDLNHSKKGKFTAFYFYQPARDQYLPIINNLKKNLIEHHEEGFGINYKYIIEQSEIDGYIIRKSTRSISTPDQTARIWTPGFRIQNRFLNSLLFCAEAAYQVGTWNTKSMQSYGGYFYGEYTLPNLRYLPRKITLGSILLSGDNLNTEKYEGWDPLFSRWPKWSESYIYALVKEGGPAYWTNFASLFAKVAADITGDIMFTIDYHHLIAPEHCSAYTPFPGGSGKTRGELVIGKISYAPRDYLSGHVILEYFNPGNYYFSSADSYTWIRFETFLNF